MGRDEKGRVDDAGYCMMNEIVEWPQTKVNKLQNAVFSNTHTDCM